MHFELKHFLETELSFEAQNKDDNDEVKYSDNSPEQKKYRRRILKVNIQKIKNDFKEIYKVIPKRRDSCKENNNDFNSQNKRDEEEYKELRRLIQEGLDMEEKQNEQMNDEKELKKNSSDYTPNNHSKRSKTSKSKKNGKSGARDQTKRSTISFTLNMIVDEDRVKQINKMSTRGSRIQSAHAMQRSKEREDSTSKSVSNSYLNRK